MENIKKDSEQGIAEEFDFLTYITSLAFQAMVFLGEIANPASNKIEKNILQAKFIIDTLSMLRDKTKGNLSQQEENMLDTSIYELQTKYVDILKKEKESNG